MAGQLTPLPLTTADQSLKFRREGSDRSNGLELGLRRNPEVDMNAVRFGSLIFLLVFI